MRKTPLSLTLTAFEIELLNALASRADRSLSYTVGRAVEHYAYCGDRKKGTALPAALSAAIEERHGTARTGTEG